MKYISVFWQKKKGASLCRWWTASAYHSHPIIPIWRPRGNQLHRQHRQHMPLRWRTFTLACHRLWHHSHSQKGGDLQPRWLLWRPNEKRWCPRRRRAPNLCQPNVLWRFPPWPICWTCYWWATYNHLRLKSVLCSISLKILINIPGPTLSGRYVIVQMDNGGDQLNLKEVRAFGRS